MIDVITMQLFYALSMDNITDDLKLQIINVIKENYWNIYEIINTITKYFAIEDGTDDVLKLINHIEETYDFLELNQFIDFKFHRVILKRIYTISINYLLPGDKRNIANKEILDLADTSEDLNIIKSMYSYVMGAMSKEDTYVLDIELTGRVLKIISQLTEEERQKIKTINDPFLVRA